MSAKGFVAVAEWAKSFFHSHHLPLQFLKSPKAKYHKPLADTFAQVVFHSPVCCVFVVLSEFHLSKNKCTLEKLNDWVVVSNSFYFRPFLGK